MIQLTPEILTLIIALIGILGTTFPVILKYKQKIHQIGGLINCIDEALEDGKISADEKVLILKKVKKMFEVVS